MQTTVDLARLAEKVMREKGLQPEFPKDAIEQLSSINSPAPMSADYFDLRSLLWCSIDNNDSRDLDQLTYAEKDENGNSTLWVAVADVSALVQKGSPIDRYAQTNTTSVYTPAKIFPMLPEKLSTNLTSLNETQDRTAVVIKIEVNQAGDVTSSSIFLALVHNHAQLTYEGVGAWLEEKSDPPEKVKQLPGLDAILKLQHEAAQSLKRKRREMGSLTLESPEAEAKVVNSQDIIIELAPHNFAHQLIEEFMIAANQAMAKHFKDQKITSLRRVVRTPKFWHRIVEIVRSYGDELPEEPDSKALDTFLINRKKQDPDSFPDLSLTIIKLLGSGEYVVENAQDEAVGHFALAVSHYTHSTAPNRRFPDLISQRQYKAFLRGEKSPYTQQELYRLAAQCTQQEDAAAKVERQMNKSAAAILLAPQIGTYFKGIITGASGKGTWVRLFHPAVEGKVVEGYVKLKVGDKVTVQLIYVDIEKGFIDFAHHGEKSTG